MENKPAVSRDAPPPLALWLVLGIAALAGFVDAISYARFKGLFVSFMSGNTTSLGVALAQGDGAKAGELARVLGWFVAGVVLGSLLHHAAGRRPAPPVLATVAGLLALAWVRPLLALGALPLAMGALNASVQELSGVKVSLTFVTGALVKLGTGLADWLRGARPPGEWRWQALLWAALGGGALAGAIAYAHRGLGALGLAAGGSLLLALAAGLAHSLK